MREWEPLFPNLGNWVCTSPVTNTYNCLSFAAGDESRRWDPCPPGNYWPPGVTRTYEPHAVADAYKTIGYEICRDGSLEDGTEKIAIYLNRMSTRVEHAARQLADGRWTSKIGGWEDIIHDTPDSLAGDEYGQPRFFMARPRRTGEADVRDKGADVTPTPPP
jgi:hypothetical protein